MCNKINYPDTLQDFEKWWALPKPVGWLLFPQAQKHAAKSSWDAAIKFMKDNFKIAEKCEKVQDDHCEITAPVCPYWDKGTCIHMNSSGSCPGRCEGR